MVCNLHLPEAFPSERTFECEEGGVMKEYVEELLQVLEKEVLALRAGQRPPLDESAHKRGTLSEETVKGMAEE